MNRRGFYVDREKYPLWDCYWRLSLRWVTLVTWSTPEGWVPRVTRDFIGRRTLRWRRWHLLRTHRPRDLWGSLQRPR